MGSKEIRTYRSSGMLKHLRKQAKQTDQWARIMELDDVPTLVCHRNGSPNKITVRLVDTETELNSNTNIRDEGLIAIGHKKGGGHMRKILIDNSKTNPRECTYGFPWRHDATCLNFRTPDEFISYHDISNIQNKSAIETLVIGCNLDNYDFISDMSNLRQLYIYSGGKISDIDFVKNLVKLQQLYIVGSHIDSLDGLVKVLEEKRRRIDAETDMWKRIELGMEGICIGSDCDSLDGKELLEANPYISEVIINGERIRKGN